MKPQPSLRDPARVGAFGPQKLLILSDVQMIHKPSQNGAHLLLIIILSKLILNPSASQMQHQQKDHVFPSQGSPALLRCLPEQSLPKPSSFIGPKLDCVRHSLAWQPVTCTFLCGLDRETIPLCPPEVKACPYQEDAIVSVQVRSSCPPISSVDLFNTAEGPESISKSLPYLLCFDDTRFQESFYS